MSVPTRVYAQTPPIPLSSLSTLLNKMSEKGWQHEATIPVGVGQTQNTIVSVQGKPQVEIALVVVLSGLVDDPNDYTLPVIEI